MTDSEKGGAMPDRKSYIGGSEIAALFDCHPYLTKYELYHSKKGSLSETKEKPVMRLGKYLEPFALREAFPTHIPAKQKQIPHPTIKGLAATPDAYTEDGSLIECKTVSSIPDHPHPRHVLQCQVQMMCTGIKQCHLLYFERTNGSFETHLIEYKDDLAKEIEGRVKAFWGDFALDIAPSPTANDMPVIKELLRNDRPTGEAVFLEDNWLNNTVHNYLAADRDEKEMDRIKDQAKTELMQFMLDHKLAKVVTGSHEIKLTISDIPERTQVVKASTRTLLTVREKKQ